MAKDLDIQITEALKAYLTSGVEGQMDFQKLYYYSSFTLLYFLTTHQMNN